MGSPDRAGPEPGEDVRRLVKACSGDWEWARRALAAAGGDLARARVMVAWRRVDGDGPEGERLRRTWAASLLVGLRNRATVGVGCL